MAVLTGTAIAIAAGASLVGAGISAAVSSNQAKANRRAAKSVRQRIEEIELDRQDVINPFDQMADLSDQITNPFSQLRVSTEAAEFQAEQADISLANALDQARAFGMAGGGATALAQGALQSKRGISADLAKQEARNEVLKAQGEQRAMENRTGEARRMQAMVAQGRAYEFETQENRTMAQLDRLAGLQTNYQTAANQAGAMTAQTLGTAIPNAVTAGLGVYNMMEG
jgi:hypothetical protein